MNEYNCFFNEWMNIIGFFNEWMNEYNFFSLFWAGHGYFEFIKCHGLISNKNIYKNQTGINSAF